MIIKGKCCGYGEDLNGNKIVKEGMKNLLTENSPIFWNFQSGVENIVGFVISSEIKDDGVYMVGSLFDHKFFEDKEINEEQIKENYGLSIMGKIIKKNQTDPKLIEECEITSVSVIPITDLADSSQRILEVIENIEVPENIS